MARRSGFTHRSRSYRPSPDWGAGVGSSSPVQVSTSSNGFLGAAVVPTIGEITLRRTRGLFVANLISATSAGDGFFGAVGIGLVTAAAFAAGISSVPTPITEAGWDGWVWHSFIEVHKGRADQGAMESQRIEIDSKAMRKFDQDMVLFAAFEVTEIATAVADLFLDSRMLFTDAGKG